MSRSLDGPRLQPASQPPVSARSKAGTSLVISGRCGRLANRIVLFANFVAFAEEHGHRVSNCTFHTYAHLFQTTSRDIYCRYPAVSRRSVFDVIPGAAAVIRKTRLFAHGARMACLLNERAPFFGRDTITYRETEGAFLEDPRVQARIASARRVFIMGWTFRAPACLERHAEKVRAYFRPLEIHERASKQIVDRLRQSADVVVGVHIRHGDYRHWRGGKYFFPISRYAAWMKELASQFSGRKVSFLICSDEPRREEEFPGLTIGCGSNVPVEDLCALARCDYVLGPVSSFSQWASFYGDAPLLHLRDSSDRLRLDQFRVSYLGEIPH